MSRHFFSPHAGALCQVLNTRRRSVPTVIPVAISSAAGATTSSALLWLVAVFAVDRPIPARLKRNSGGLSAASANDHCFGTCVGTVTGRAPSILLAIRARTLLRFLTARLTALGRRVTTLLKVLLFHCGKYKFLPALAASKCQIGGTHGLTSPASVPPWSHV